MKNSPTTKLSKSIKHGDAFALGNHILICGDAKDANLIAQHIGKRKISIVLSDPPYGVAYVESKRGWQKSIGRHSKIENDQIQSEEVYRKFTADWMKVIILHLASKNTFYIFNSDKMLFALRDGMRDAGCKFSQLLIWIKSQAVIGRLDYLPQHELIAYGWCGKHPAIKAKDKSLLYCPKPKNSKLHPTMKPISLLRRIILNSSKIGDTIYDPFGGSGSTLIACEHTKRKCVMVETDPRYCRIIIDRWEKLTGNTFKKLIP